MMNKLGQFQILGEVGRGGMGTVYRGLDPVIGRPVAIKVIRMLGYKDADEQLWMRGRLFREARAAGMLCHSGIVTIYQVAEDDDVAYIAMEFVGGPTLKHLLEQDPPPDKGMLCRVLLEAAEALDYAHDRGLVHRDIKPENIMLTEAGATKVTDFGIAKTMLGQTATATGAMAGTPLYMSPEQVRGKQLDGRSDQFALAVIAYRIFTGRAPFEADHITSVCYQIIHEEPPSPEDLVPGLGAGITSVIKRGLSKEPEQRFNTCTEFARALLAAYENRSPPETTKSKPARFTPAIAPAAGRTIGRVTITMTAATLVFGAGLAFTRIPASKPAVAAAAQSRVASPAVQTRGFLVWTGNAREGELLTISGHHSSSGSLSGALPARPVKIKVDAAALTSESLTVFTSDASRSSVSTARVPVIFNFDPRHATDFTVFETPSAANQWQRLVIQTNTNVQALFIEWTLDE